MSTAKYNGELTYIDETGNETVLYPITRRENVGGMEYIDNHLVNANNPHGVTPKQIGAATAGHIHDGVYLTAPPLNAGVEYLTDELYMGAPVYRKLIVFSYDGALGDEYSHTTVEIPHGIPDLYRVIRCETSVNNDVVLPYVSTLGGITAVNCVKSSAIVVRIFEDVWNSPTFYFDIAYIK